jgi:hypothetical protein
MDSARAWTEAARGLGLALYEPDGLSPRDDVDAMLSALGPWSGQPSTTAWMAGQRRGHDVLATLQSSTHSDHHHTYTTHQTLVMARVSPPLFLGLRVVPVNTFDRLGLLATPPPVGDPAFDAVLHASGFEQEAVRRFLARREAPGRDLLDRLAALSAHRVRLEVSDNVVRLSDSNVVTEGPVLAWWLDEATAIAAALGERRRATPSGPFPSWIAFAEARGLALDAEQQALTGPYAGVPVRLALATDDGAAQTHLRAFFPRPLGLGLRVSREAPILHGLGKLFGMQDIELGDPAFDRAFLIKGQPADRVRQLFGAPEARARLLGILGRAKQLTVDDRALDVRVAGFQTDPATLAAMLDDATATVRAMVGWAAPG